MTDGDQNGEQDPLLVRPFVLRDSGASDVDDSTQTWPATATGETTGLPAHDGADAPTVIMHLPFRRRHAAGKARPSSAGNGHRRLIVLGAAAAVVVLGAAAAGYAALGSDVRPSVAPALPGGPLPAATAPVSPSNAASSSSIGDSQTEQRPGGTATGATSSSPATPTSGSTSPLAPLPGSPTAGEPISLDPGPTSDSNKPAPTSDPRLVAPQPPTADRTGVIRGQNSLCLDLNGAVPTDGNHVQVYDCNSTVAQTWTLATDGTLRVMGKCALLVGDNSVEIVTCDGRTPAQWRAVGQLLINSANAGCLTDPSGGRTSGTGVTVTECSGSASQRWSLP
ncbi:ricin-type beta-trefoil lectin domain protein [Actinoplanes bogorensis]|uniref:Ricin-type beta-trefoil lectin domain protein n=1 Tax=Paractinoplanes bogorensis TaxID=1610840 RepID=A0ABS5Z226_9ACTN|nr:RICIN domain-containing protein [Actinoplanes bogorensis]MBU2669381.1 ricin-type beta-trefoil lectin domain protein [Actinoplanes bogorensis]